MTNQAKYISKLPNENGVYEWTEIENDVWKTLYHRQLGCIKNAACAEFLIGLEKLNLPHDKIPQLKDVTRVLKQATGWQCQQVPALIGFSEFFKLLSEKKFPVATFIRTKEDMDYLQEPDIFHEIFGHCPLLTNQDFADFTQKYGELGLRATKEQRTYLARLYWFTVEFGLMNHSDGLKIYGGGILSSPAETLYALYDAKAIRKPLDVIEVFRTPYRIDILQPIYFIIGSLKNLSSIAELDLLELVSIAKKLGLRKPLFCRDNVA